MPGSLSSRMIVAEAGRGFGSMFAISSIRWRVPKRALRPISMLASQEAHRGLCVPICPRGGETDRREAFQPLLSRAVANPRAGGGASMIEA